jgi:hypothetical protein
MAQDFFNANWRKKHGVKDDVKFDVAKPSDTSIRGSAEVNVPTTFMSLAGIISFDVRVTSEIKLARESVEVAQVLDVTNSMAGSKIDALKSSANGLIDKAFAGEGSRDTINVALVPFADYVNVGMENRNEPWISVPPGHLDDTRSLSRRLPGNHWSIELPDGNGHLRSRRRINLVLLRGLRL